MTACNERSMPSKLRRDSCSVIDRVRGRQVEQSHCPCSRRCNEPTNHTDVSLFDTPFEAGPVAKRNLGPCRSTLEHLPSAHECINRRANFCNIQLDCCW